MKGAAEETLEQIDEGLDPATEVTADPDPPAAAAADDKPVVIDPAEFKRLEKAVKAADKRARESDQTARYWAEQARAQPEKKAPDPDPEPDEDIDLVSEITTNGAKGLAKVLDKLGYVKRRDVEQSIASTRNEITQDAAMLRDYPDLADTKSPFFRATAAIYNSLTADDERAKNNPKTIRYAARLAKAEMATAPRRRGDPDPDEDLDSERYDDDPDAARIARQAGDRGRRAAGGGAQPETLDRMQKEMVANFRRAGGEITEESYMKRAKEGVRMGGVPQRRAA